jgi:hypothetical protein
MHAWNWLFRILPAVVKTGMPLHLLREQLQWLTRYDSKQNSSQIATRSSTVLLARTESLNYCTYPRQSRIGDSSPRVQRRQGPPWRGQQVPDWLLSIRFYWRIGTRCCPCPLHCWCSHLWNCRLYWCRPASSLPSSAPLSFDTSLRSSACAASCALITLHHDQSLRHN